MCMMCVFCGVINHVLYLEKKKGVHSWETALRETGIVLCGCVLFLLSWKGRGLSVHAVTLVRPGGRDVRQKKTDPTCLLVLITTGT